MTDTALPAQRTSAETTVFAIIFAVSFCHFLNDMMQSLLSAIYPMLKQNYGLDFKQMQPRRGLVRIFAGFGNDGSARHG